MTMQTILYFRLSVKIEYEVFQVAIGKIESARDLAERGKTRTRKIKRDGAQNEATNSWIEKRMCVFEHCHTFSKMWTAVLCSAFSTQSIWFNFRAITNTQTV